jgi:hypothetical protein
LSVANAKLLREYVATYDEPGWGFAVPYVRWCAYAKEWLAGGGPSVDVARIVGRRRNPDDVDEFAQAWAERIMQRPAFAVA